MRGGRTAAAALCLSLLACASPPPALPPAPPAPAVEKTAPKPAPGVPPESLYRFTPSPAEQDFTPGGGIKGVARTSAEAPKPDPTFQEVLRLQRDVVARPSAVDDDRLRLALLLASAGELEEAEKVAAAMKGPGGKLGPYLDLFLRRQLGDHREAAKALALLNEEERKATGFVIERAELCARVRRFRDYTAADSDRVAPGGLALLYVEPRNFAARREGERHALHLKYEWKLFDDRSVEVPVTAWEAADEGQKEDRLTTLGPIREFYQSFKLPLPANLAAGPYRIKVTVTDAVAGKSDRVYVPITVGTVER
ncbi:MAG TPA: hypothetical protein VF950_29485 [Planctomycetota bacterium]